MGWIVLVVQKGICELFCEGDYIGETRRIKEDVDFIIENRCGTESESEIFVFCYLRLNLHP